MSHLLASLAPPRPTWDRATALVERIRHRIAWSVSMGRPRAEYLVLLARADRVRNYLVRQLADEMGA